MSDGNKRSVGFELGSCRLELKAYHSVSALYCHLMTPGLPANARVQINQRKDKALFDSLVALSKRIRALQDMMNDSSTPVPQLIEEVKSVSPTVVAHIAAHASASRSAYILMRLAAHSQEKVCCIVVVKAGKFQYNARRGTNDFPVF